MKCTIKQWCIEKHLNWYGQGVIGQFRYDWVVMLGKGRRAIFSSINTNNVPLLYPLRDHDVLIFPNINSSSQGGKISEQRFDRIIAWADTCLSGGIMPFDKFMLPSQSNGLKDREKE